MFTQILVFKLRSELTENRFTYSLFEAAATWGMLLSKKICGYLTEKRSTVNAKLRIHSRYVNFCSLV